MDVYIIEDLDSSKVALPLGWLRRELHHSIVTLLDIF